MRIGIIGDYNPVHESHPATTQAVFLAARSIGHQVDVVWISTAKVDDATLAKCDAIWCAPGSPYRSADGMIQAIRYAREGKRPLLGTCGGFQYALIEYARNVLGIANADTAENNTPGAVNVITPVSCPSPTRNEGEPKLVGMNMVTVLPDTHLAHHMGPGEHREGLFCNFEPNAEFTAKFTEAGLRPCATGPQGELRAVELVDHPFFIATLFQPQLTSKRTGKPHPLLIAYMHAAGSFHAQSKKTSRKPAKAASEDAGS
jgi:CTP synthase